MLYGTLKPLALALMRLGLRLEIRGRQHVPASGPVLIVSNHVSVLDPPVVGASAPRELHFVAKEELFAVPLFGRLLRALNARPVKRDGSDSRALRTALRLLAEDRALLMFPEGTRGVEGRLGEGKAGAGMLAVMSKAPVVPVYVSGTGRALPPGCVVPRPAKVRVTFGPPLHFKSGGDEGRKERYREAAHEMMRAIAQLRDEQAA
ncbi:MAG: 1-acyl-sn-glycerol-3-phosphate acyltransferase [Candidatus Rokuibacteriota bacterium]|nr:MAG: 1-acyl-sn-glycerol-3-phosphate acyltransferase [Candidatus Rokubacteria bacterium]